jgi:ankyrin repeat protein
MASKLSKTDRRVLSKLLMDAVQDGKDVKIVTALLHAGADPDYRNRTVDAKGITPLMAAGSHYYLLEDAQALVKAFKAAGADLFATDSKGTNAAGFAHNHDNDALETALKQGMRPIKCWLK